MSNTKLNLKGNQEETLIQQFKNREEQTSLEEALVYLKLRNHKCNSSKALIFSKKYTYSKKDKKSVSMGLSPKMDQLHVEN